MGGFCGIDFVKVKHGFNKVNYFLTMDALAMCTIFPFIVTMALLKSKMKKLKNEAKAKGGLLFILPVPFPFVYFSYIRNIKKVC